MTSSCFSRPTFSILPQLLWLDADESGHGIPAAPAGPCLSKELAGRSPLSPESSELFSFRTSGL